MLWPLLYILIFLPMLMAHLFFHAAVFSFSRLGLTPKGAFLLFTLSVLGSAINIPVYKQRLPSRHPDYLAVHPFYFFYYPPKVNYQVICVNVGGAVIPVLFSLHLLATRADLIPSLLGIAVVTAISKALARIVPGVGIAMPAFVSPIAAALVALLLAPHNPAPVAYVSGVLGTFLGADILNLPRIKQLEAQVVSIGGAGIFDGIFLVGLVAALLS